MTISIAIRTPSALAFATDSRKTTQVFGPNPDHIPSEISDDVQKLAVDTTGRLMAMVSGDPQAGEQDIVGAVESYSLPDVATQQEQFNAISEFASGLYVDHEEFRRKIEPNKLSGMRWSHGPTIVFGVERPRHGGLCILHADLVCDPLQIQEVSQDVFLEGSFHHVQPLVFEADGTLSKWFSDELAKAQGDPERLVKLATALAHKQVQMENLASKTEPCGGPINAGLLVVTGSSIVSFPDVPYSRSVFPARSC